MPSKRIFVTGASGFVGSAVVEELLAREYAVNGLSRSGTMEAPPGGGDLRTITGDLFDDAALDAGMRDADAVIHLVGIIVEKPSQGVTFERIHYEGTRQVVDAAKRNNVRRYVHMSALGTRADGVSEYHRTKYEAEQYVRQNAPDWTIIQPSMIHGPRGEFMKMEAAWVRGKAAPWLFMPYFGRGLLGLGGAGLIQPVYVKDVARAFVHAIQKPSTIVRTYVLGGRDAMTWPRMHETVAVALTGKRRRTLAIPAWYAKFLTGVVPRSLLPFNRDQVIMSQEENTCDLTDFRADFGWYPAGFVESLKQYKAQL